MQNIFSRNYTFALPRFRETIESIHASMRRFLQLSSAGLQFRKVLHESSEIFNVRSRANSDEGFGEIFAPYTGRKMICYLH